jgi:hypothetical protein
LIEVGQTEEVNSQGTSVVEECFMALSEAAAMGKEAPRTLKLGGIIHEVEVLILIDSGSSHSFISEQVAASLLGVSPSAQPTLVRVANGQIVQSCSELLQTKWSVQGYVFQSDLRVLQLQSFDMLIGMEWMERYSPMKVHWSRKWMFIPYSGTHVTLQGMIPGYLTIILFYCCNYVQLLILEQWSSYLRSCKLSLQNFSQCLRPQLSYLLGDHVTIKFP